MNSSFMFDDVFLTLYKEKKRFHVNFIFRALCTDKCSGNLLRCLSEEMIK
ncbi:hypothetical protein J2780_000349 [Chryseobacterium camelliae]|nr:hypothetical protein [Chryseobacterium camelliae]